MTPHEQEDFEAWTSRHDRFDGFDRGDLDNSFLDGSDERTTRRCPHCGLLTWEDQIETPTDYCHHDVIPD